MTKMFQDKTALITGGSKGIGKAIALKLAGLGARVAINYGRDAQSAEEVVSQITKSGGEALAIQADMASGRDIARMFATTVERFGGLDFLVNNAGIAIFKPVAEVTEEDYRTLFDINVKGVFFCCQEGLKHLSDGGRIVNISSTVTKVMMPAYGLYAASKAAVEEITKSLAKELGSRRITVNSVSPGPTDTVLFRQGKSDEQIAHLAAMAALNRLGQPEDIANAVALILSDDAAWITGQDICANGGMATH